MVTDDCASYGLAPYAVHEAYGGFMNIGKHTYNAGSQFTFGISNVFSGWGGYIGGPTYTTTITFLGSAACIGGGYYINCWANGSFEVPNPWVTQFINPGFLSGTKFGVGLNGVIVTQGQGINYFPGNLPGFTNTGGQYA
jgi:hypothetical protein